MGLRTLRSNLQSPCATINPGKHLEPGRDRHDPDGQLAEMVEYQIRLLIARGPAALRHERGGLLAPINAYDRSVSSILAPPRRTFLSVTPSTIAWAAPWPVCGNTGWAASPTASPRLPRTAADRGSTSSSQRRSSVPAVTARKVSSNRGTVRKDRSRIAHACRNKFSRQRERPIDACIARPGQERLDARAERVINAGETVQVMHGPMHGAAHGHDPLDRGGGSDG